MKKRVAAIMISIIAIAGVGAEAHTERTLEIHCDDYGFFQYSVIVEDGWFEVEDETYGVDDGIVTIEEDEYFIDEYGNEYFIDDGVVEIYG